VSKVRSWFAVSPIVFEDVLIVPNDQEKGGGAHYGLDCKTGKIAGKYPGQVSGSLTPPPVFLLLPKENRN